MVIDNISTGIINFVLFLIVVFFRRVIHNEGIKSFLLHFNRKGRQFFLKGLLKGILFFALYPLIVIISRQGKIYIYLQGIKNTLLMVLSGIFTYLSVSLLEESFFRGYMLQKLSIIFPTNIAIILSSIFFGLFHIQAYSSSNSMWIGIMNATLIGIIFSIVVVRTKSLMLPLGYHLSWNLIQGVLFMNYKYETQGLINLQIKESLWTGYSIIPESGFIITIICFIILIYLQFKWKNRKK